MSISENTTLLDRGHVPTRKSSLGGVGFDWAFLVPCTWLMMGAALLVVRRWRLPLGAFALIYTIPSIVSSLMAKSSPVIAVTILAAVTGLLIDVLYKGLKPSTERKSALRLFAFGVSVVIYAIYFLSLAVIKGIAWSVHLWVGSIVMAGIVGLLLSYVLVQPQLPSEQVASHRDI